MHLKIDHFNFFRISIFINYLAMSNFFLFSGHELLASEKPLKYLAMIVLHCKLDRPSVSIVV